ncbi:MULTISPECIES: lipase family protein [Bacillus cereus group]|uniref:Lipase n=1 Tax=Bacillus thuringiensis TaxID=1428 RepID=A0A1C4GD69_BACTU|nr:MULTISPECIES: lipase family protein [Bacillus cereus group]MED3021377.1 lipase family protein [Bacillus wiedmannii]OTX98005.1 lipase [Bacillus thuringiensis serovar wratislaviensis]OUB57221.1 lipase [Bacillus thuringiensis serovar sylvestriensis]SCC65711.1 Lipase [Bacillus thuringiensis]
MRTPLSFDKDTAILLASCCELTYEQYKQNGIFEIPDGFQYVQGFQGKTIQTTEWFGFILESEDTIIVAFRGTQTDTDWIIDSLVNQKPYPYALNSGNVHNGFLSIYESCRDSIMDMLVSLPAHKKLLTTGHSLGGALATLHILDARINTAFAQYGLYTFASPKVGDIAFRNYYKLQVASSFRFVNLFDVVPLLPPRNVHFNDRDWEYAHVHHNMTFTKNTKSITNNHAMTTYKTCLTSHF